MPDARDESNERNAVRDRLGGVSIEPGFDYSWLSKDPPRYEDVDDDGQVIEQSAPEGDC